MGGHEEVMIYKVSKGKPYVGTILHMNMAYSSYMHEQHYNRDTNEIEYRWNAVSIDGGEIPQSKSYLLNADDILYEPLYDQNNRCTVY